MIAQAQLRAIANANKPKPGVGIVRELSAGNEGSLNPVLRIVVKDEPGPGGANHHYQILMPNPNGPGEILAGEAKFQNGPISNNADINGISNEALLAIVQDRLEGFSKGPYPSDFTNLALASVSSALEHLGARTAERVEREVEGTLQP